VNTQGKGEAAEEGADGKADNPDSIPDSAEEK
jgi:hypothetical protein